MPNNHKNKAQLTVRRERVFNKRLTGQSLRSIARDEGVALSTVQADIKAYTDELILPLAEEERKRQLEQIDLLLDKVWAILNKDHVVVQHGKVVYDKDGSPLVDEDIVIKAAAQYSKLIDQRAKLTGAYTPIQTQVEATVQQVTQEDLAIMDIINSQKAKNQLSKAELASADQVASEAESPTEQ